MRYLFILFVFFLLGSGTSGAQGTRYPEVEIGSKAPDFSLPFATRDTIEFNEISLSSFADSQYVVLAFYPADWSGGCTKEVCTFRDHFDSLALLDAEVLAISGDYLYSHHEWAKHHNLPFKLLSDHRHRVAATYNSYNESTGYNLRTVYLIDKEGTVVYRDMDYSTRDLTSFEKLRSAISLLKDTDH